MSTARAVNPPELPRAIAEKFGYSFAVRSGDTLRISGMVAMDGEGAAVGGDDVTAQTEKVFDNLAAVLAAAGGSLDDVVETVTYTTDRSHLAGIGAVRTRRLTGPLPPTSTLIVVAGLARPDFLVEISAVAVLL